MLSAGLCFFCVFGSMFLEKFGLLHMSAGGFGTLSFAITTVTAFVLLLSIINLIKPIQDILKSKQNETSDKLKNVAGFGFIFLGLFAGLTGSVLLDLSLASSFNISGIPSYLPSALFIVAISCLTIGTLIPKPEEENQKQDAIANDKRINKQYLARSNLANALGIALQLAGALGLLFEAKGVLDPKGWRIKILLGVAVLGVVMMIASTVFSAQTENIKKEQLLQSSGSYLRFFLFGGSILCIAAAATIAYCQIDYSHFAQNSHSVVFASVAGGLFIAGVISGVVAFCHKYLNKNAILNEHMTFNDSCSNLGTPTSQTRLKSISDISSSSRGGFTN